MPIKFAAWVVLGLIRRAEFVRRSTRHGETGSSTYWSWVNMHRRCENPSMTDYDHYGGRGISVCSQWKTFEQFLNDMGQKPKGFLLDRIRNDLGYEPSNCRWASPQLSAINRTSTKLVGFNGELITIAEAARRLGRTPQGLGWHLKAHPVYAANAALVRMRKKPNMSRRETASYSIEHDTQ